MRGMDYKAQIKEWKRRRERMLDLLQRGISESEVARRFKITRQRVHQIARAAK